MEGTGVLFKSNRLSTAQSPKAHHGLSATGKQRVMQERHVPA